MVCISLIFSLLFSFSAEAVVPSGAPTITVGGFQANSPGGSTLSPTNFGGSGSGAMFELAGGSVGNLAAGNFYPWVKNGTLYQVTNGKTAYCSSLFGISGGNNASMQLCSATSAVAFNDASLTGGVYESNAAARYVEQFPALGTYYTINLFYTFASQTYPCFQAASATYYQIHMTCWEQ